MRFSAFPVLLRYFNSQPHKEADLERDPGFIDFGISTHSLTRRLTGNAFIFVKRFSISTHSLTRRLTKKIRIKRTHRNISTHSLTRRLTLSAA